MSRMAVVHNRLIACAIMADLRGAEGQALALRFAASLLAVEINRECAERKRKLRHANPNHQNMKGEARE